MTIDTRDFLEAITGYADSSNADGPAPSSADRPILLATVAPGYTVGDPTVKFDGETTTGTRTYKALVPVRASERVVMVPVGRTYVILGALGSSALVDRIATLERGLAARGIVPSSVVVGSGSATVASDGTVSFTGCSSISLNDVFDGLGGDGYAVHIRYACAAAAVGNLRLRAAGVDASGSNYERGYVFGQAASVTGADTGGQDKWFLGTTGTDRTLCVLELTSPALAEPTTGMIRWGAGNGVGVLIAGASHSPTTAYPSLTFFTSASTASGWIKVVKIT